MLQASSQKAATLRALHVAGDPLVLPNAWDAASARLVEAAGFPVVATSSAATAAVLGYDDGEAAPVEQVLAAAALRAQPSAAPVPEVQFCHPAGRHLRQRPIHLLIEVHTGQSASKWPRIGSRPDPQARPPPRRPARCRSGMRRHERIGRLPLGHRRSSRYGRTGTRGEPCSAVTTWSCAPPKWPRRCD